MGACLACCAFDAGLGIVTGSTKMFLGCLPWGEAQSARFMNAIVFFIYSFITYGVLYAEESVGNFFPIENCDSQCYIFYSGYRMGFALAAYHLILAIALVGVGSKDDSRSAIQEGFWPVKLITLLLLAFGSFWVPPRFLDYLFIPAVVIGSIFLIVQAILLVDLAYSWAEGMLEKAEEGVGIFQALLIGSTFLMNAGVIAIVVFIYMYFETNMERTLATVNGLLIVIMSICSILPSVQDANPSAGLFQSSLLGFYSLFVLTAAFINDPTAPKGPNEMMVTYPILSKIVSSTSVVFVFLVMARGALNTGTNLHRMNPDAEKGGALDNDDEAAGRYNYSLFHIGFVMAAIYTTLYVTFWQYTIVKEKTIVVIDAAIGFWSRVVSSWIVALIYMWSLFAPVFIEDRSF